MATCVKLQLGSMIVVSRPCGTDDSQVIHALADMRPPVAHLDSALSAFPITDLHGVKLCHQLARTSDELDHVLLRERSIENISVGVSSMLLPAYLFSIGLGSKDSTWLTPPSMKSQMTFLALGGKWGFPSGGDQFS
jgi:hypothetical protein